MTPLFCLHDLSLNGRSFNIGNSPKPRRQRAFLILDICVFLLCWFSWAQLDHLS